jgi:hypothetical protein
MTKAVNFAQGHAVGKPEPLDMPMAREALPRRERA